MLARKYTINTKAHWAVRFLFTEFDDLRLENKELSSFRSQESGLKTNLNQVHKTRFGKSLYSVFYLKKVSISNHGNLLGQYSKGSDTRESQSGVGIGFEELVTDCVTTEGQAGVSRKLKQRWSLVTSHVIIKQSIMPTHLTTYMLFLYLPKKLFTERSKLMKLFATLHLLITQMHWFTIIHRLSIMCQFAQYQPYLIVIHLSIST